MPHTMLWLISFNKRKSPPKWPVFSRRMDLVEAPSIRSCFSFLCISPTSEDGKSRRITLGSSSPWCSTSGGHCWIPHPLSCHQSRAGFAHTDQSPELFSIFPHRTLQKRGVQEQHHNLFVPWKELERMHQTTWQARTSGCTENRKTSFLINSEQSWLSKAPIVLLNFSSHRTAVRCRLLCCCKWRKIKTLLGITSFPIKSRLPIHHQHFKLFCSIQALWHCGCFYHESLTKQGRPHPYRKKMGVKCLKTSSPHCSGHKNVITEDRLEDSGLCSPGLVLQLQQWRGDVRAGIHPKWGTST